MSNNDQNITSSLNSFPASGSFSHFYSHTTVTNDNTYETTKATEATEIFQNTQPSCFHDEQI
ncbi:3709_t:CDS:1, partial [Racocetra fulgida]